MSVYWLAVLDSSYFGFSLPLCICVCTVYVCPQLFFYLIWGTTVNFDIIWQFDCPRL